MSSLDGDNRVTSRDENRIEKLEVGHSSNVTKISDYKISKVFFKHLGEGVHLSGGIICLETK